MNSLKKIAAQIKRTATAASEELLRQLDYFLSRTVATIFERRKYKREVEAAAYGSAD